MIPEFVAPEAFIRCKFPSHGALSLMQVICYWSRHSPRKTEANAQMRNKMVVALADRFFLPYANPGGKTETLCREVITQGKSVYTFDTEYTQNLIELGAKNAPQIFK